MNCFRGMACAFLIALVAVTFAGCSDGSDEVIVPNKPPLSAEAAKEKVRKQQQERIKSVQDQAKRSGKK